MTIEISSTSSSYILVLWVYLFLWDLLIEVFQNQIDWFIDEKWCGSFGMVLRTTTNQCLFYQWRFFLPTNSHKRKMKKIVEFCDGGDSLLPMFTFLEFLFIIIWIFFLQNYFVFQFSILIKSSMLFEQKNPPTWGLWLSGNNSFILNQLSGVRSLALGMERH